MTRFRGLIAFALAVPLSACSGDPADTALVARAADHELSVEEEARLLAPQSQLPNQREVALALADLWVDYILLATAAAEDSTFGHLDVTPLTRQRAEQAMVTALRDSVIQVDTTLSDAELRRLYDEEAPASQVHARHILITLPPQPTQAQIDSVREGMEQLRTRIVEGGEDFADLARQYSEDPGSAAAGGDLGFFGREQMVAPFADAAFSLEPGQVSEPVQTRFGFHLIRVEERRTPTLDEYREEIQSRRVAEAEAAYVQDLEERAAAEVVDGAADIVRQVASNPAARISGRAAGRDLVRYTGGTVTVDEIRQYLLSRPIQFRNQVARAQDAQIEEAILRPLARRELLMSQARREGWGVQEEQLQDVASAARQSIAEVVRRLDLLDPDTPIEDNVRTLLEDVLQDRRDAIPLGAISFILREHYSAEIYETGIPQVLERVERIRASGGTDTTEGGPATDR